MSKDIKLNSSEWIDFVFEEKNREYGAYYLRDTSGRVHIYALLTVLALMLLLIAGVMWSSSVKARKAEQEQLGLVSTTVELTNIADLDVKLPEETVKVETQQEVVAQEVKLRESLMFTAPVIEDDVNVNPLNRMKSQQQVQESTAMISIADIEGSKDLDAVDIADLKEIKFEVEKEKTDNRLYDSVDQMPQFPGGAGALYQFISSNVKYPQSSAASGTEGMVLVRFVVEKDGAIGDVRVLQGLDAACNAEAIRVIRSMPRWTPGKHQGKTVRVWFTQSIIFEL